MVNIIHNFIYMSVCMSYKNDTVRKKEDFMKELRLIKHMCKKNLCFAIIGLLKIWL